MYNFVLAMYRMGRIGEAEVAAFVGKGHISEAEAEQIIVSR